MPTLMQLSLIFVGSGAGGVLRFWVGRTIQGWWGPHFPLGTFVVNVSGCLAMGFLATAMTNHPVIREEYRAAILVGLLGGYTTFSAFSMETFTLARDGGWWRASGYVLGSVFISLLAVWIGSAIAGRMTTHS